MSELSKCVLNCRQFAEKEEKEAVKQNWEAQNSSAWFGDHTTLVKCRALRCAAQCTAAHQQKHAIWNTVGVLNAPYPFPFNMP